MQAQIDKMLTKFPSFVSALRKKAEDNRNIRTILKEVLSYITPTIETPDPYVLYATASYAYPGELTGFTESYVNGVRTLTSTSTGKLVIENITLSSAGTRILLHSQTDPKQNGMYEVVTSADGVPWVLKRDDDWLTSEAYTPGKIISVTSGETYRTAKFRITNTIAPTPDVDEITLELMPWTNVGQITDIQMVMLSGVNRSSNLKVPPGMYRLTYANAMTLGTGTTSDKIEIYRLRSDTLAENKTLEIDVSSGTSGSILLPSSMTASYTIFGRTINSAYKSDIVIKNVNGGGDDFPTTYVNLGLVRLA